jgi:peptide/nickel transport system substrate-binding protein/oligopeptide transport system substrate-binding protein
MRPLIGLLLILLCLALAGCDVPHPLPTIEKTPQPRPDSQQTLRILDVGVKNDQLNSLDPATAYFPPEREITQLVFPPLLTLDTRLQPVDWAAERHEVSVDGLTYTFHLRPGIHWSDGMTIDATTFAYSINRGLDPCLNSYTAYYIYLSAIKGSEAFYNLECPLGARSSPASLVGSSLLTPDPLTLQVVLSHPSGGFLAALTSPPAFAVPRQLVEKYGEEWTDHLADNGGFGGNLYRMTHLDDEGHITLTRNETFWGAKPKLHTIEYQLHDSDQAAWVYYQRGDGDVVTPPDDQIATARSIRGFHQVPDPSVLYLGPNWRRSPFDDARVRQAFSLALDRKALVANVSQGATRPTIHMIPEGMPGYNADLRDAAGRSGDDALTADKAKAVELWNAYLNDKSPQRSVACGEIYLMPVTHIPRVLQALSAAVKMWNDTLPDVKVEVYTVSGVLSLDWQKRVPITEVDWYADYLDPQQLIDPLIRTNTPDSITGATLPAADILLDAAASNLNPEGRLAQYQQAEQIAVSQAAFIPISQNLHSWVALPALVGGWAYTSAGSVPLSAWQSAYLVK